MLWVIEHVIYEAGSSDPVLRHSFYGKTPAEAEAVHQAHLRADAFLRGCETTGHYGQIPCRVEVSPVMLARG
jgi:hypothetical protein